MCRSTCFGCLHAHHQEHTTALTASGFTLERGGSSVVGRGVAGPSGLASAECVTTEGGFLKTEKKIVCFGKRVSEPSVDV
jgi:hypothetical protein